MISLLMRTPWMFSWLGLACLCTVASAASFSCGLVSSSVEKLICLDYRLSDLDSQMAAAYVAKQAQPDTELRSSQSKWLANRNRCRSFSCVRDAYIDRISILQPAVGETYATLRVPSPKRWEYVPPDGSTIDGRFILNGRMLAMQRGSFGSDKWEWVSLDEGKTIPREFVDKLPPYEPLLLNDRTENLGGNFVLSTAGPSMCLTKVGELGLKVINAKSLSGSEASRVLVALVSEKWTNSEPSANCFELELSYRRASFAQSTVYENSLYWLDKKFSIRFDQRLWTQSDLVGKKVFLVWGGDLSAMVEAHCKAFDRECADKRFRELLENVSSFYR